MPSINANFLQTAVKIAKQLCKDIDRDFVSITEEGVLYSTPVPGTDKLSHAWIPWDKITDTGKLS